MTSTGHRPAFSGLCLKTKESSTACCCQFCFHPSPLLRHEYFLIVFLSYAMSGFALIFCPKSFDILQYKALRQNFTAQPFYSYDTRPVRGYLIHAHSLFLYDTARASGRPSTARLPPALLLLLPACRRLCRRLFRGGARRVALRGLGRLAPLRLLFLLWENARSVTMVIERFAKTLHHKWLLLSAMCVHGTLSGSLGDVLKSKKLFRKLTADQGL
jgi:hypothetical protein